MQVSCGHYRLRSSWGFQYCHFITILTASGILKAFESATIIEFTAVHCSRQKRLPLLAELLKLAIANKGLSLVIVTESWRSITLAIIIIARTKMHFFLVDEFRI